MSMRNSFKYGASVEEIAVISDDELNERVTFLRDAMNQAARSNHDPKSVEIEMSWYVRELQIREHRRKVADEWEKRQPKSDD